MPRRATAEHRTTFGRYRGTLADGGIDLELREANPSERQEFEAFVGQHVFGDPLQSWAWGDVKAEFGWTAHRFWIVDHRRRLGSLSVLRRALPLFGELLYAPRGPVLDPTDAAAWRGLGPQLRRTFPRAFVLVAEPRIDERRKRPPGFWQGRRRGRFGGIQPRFVAEISLVGEEHEIFSHLAPKCRYNVRLAARRGVTVRRGRGPDRATFLRLMQITARRDGFGLRAPRFYAQVLAALCEADQGALFLAERAGETVAGVFAVRLGRHALYLYGASSDEHRRDMAPYLAQWEAIRWAAAGGAERYDMTGIAPRDDPRHPLYGLRRFKLGWGAGERRYLGPLDLPLRPWPYLLYRLAEPLAARVSLLRAGPVPRTAQ